MWSFSGKCHFRKRMSMSQGLQTGLPWTLQIRGVTAKWTSSWLAMLTRTIGSKLSAWAIDLPRRFFLVWLLPVEFRRRDHDRRKLDNTFKVPISGLLVHLTRQLSRQVPLVRDRC